LLSVYFTAGFPQLEDTVPIIEALSESGVDLIEIGIPFSDPIADGPTIQDSNMRAIRNGMTIPKLLDQLAMIRSVTEVPLILMGYVNPVIQYGPDQFCRDAAKIGIDALILPDLPPREYETEYLPVLKQHGLFNVFLITPQTPPERINQIDRLSEAFIYMVSSSSITGKKAGISPEQLAYFRRIKEMNLHHARLIGFGIHDHESFSTACEYASGAIVGSAFIRALETGNGPLKQTIKEFIEKLRLKSS